MQGKGVLLSNFRIFEARDFVEDLREITGKQWERVYLKIKEDVYPQLMNQPYFGRNIKKLRGYNPETWRYRIGDLRIFYEIDKKGRIVLVTAAYPRKDAYR